ncbi:MAG: tRNA 2-thiouridine(34) synthase MnmA [Parcubacteria group bacterium]|nr:tRNA 2-thiouridine(34) synthase MnmA [Parcubacteria group bacterium]
MKKKENLKVVVAMSGGVDSSVTAALLQRAGFDVTGVFMKFWTAPSSGKGGWNRCCSIEATERARKTAQQLGIPFYVLNFADEFKKRIVDYFLEEYKQGRTPNPCVVCNKEIKFGLLLEKALGLEADFIATGHYGKIQCATQCKLTKAKDKTKDQSYFLWQLNQKQLKKVLLPVGGYTKKEVRALASEFNLPAAETKESQEVCFIETTTADFLKKYLKQKSGDIVTPDGKVVGKHQGLWFYTIGQRKGIGLSSGPFYVISKDMKKNVLTVSKDKKDLEKKELVAKNINWISGKEPKMPYKVMAKIRYNSPLASAVIKEKLSNGRLRIVFTKPQKAVTPGQSVVFYKGQELLGGGIIC